MSENGEYVYHVVLRSGGRTKNDAEIPGNYDEVPDRRGV